MKKVFIKYNPYKLETEITVDGNRLADNSFFSEKAASGSRLQEWVEELPKKLIEEYNDNEFDITFHGTLPDYEDLTEVFTQAYEAGSLTAKLQHIPAKETSDKEALIKKVFEKIQNGPFDELRDAEIISAFDLAKSRDFEVCVVATMSAGKSTLINALLGTKLMPSKQEACTAVITRIRDARDGEKNWRADVYDKNGGKIGDTIEDLHYSQMQDLNSDPLVSTIKIDGDIPFVTSEDVSLVLIDTPGPNNSRDPEHKKVQSEFLRKSSKSLVLYIMEGTFGSDDDNALLHCVAESMKVGGKQSKDRFIFVVNKMDERKEEDGDIESMLDRVRDYLKDFEITNPNLFPAAALPALDIRLAANGAEIDKRTERDVQNYVELLNGEYAENQDGKEYFYLEKHAPLPNSIRESIGQQLAGARSAEDANAEALIHTGIVSVEAAIRQYVRKYAKAAKIKNIVDTFMHKLDEVGYEAKLENEIAQGNVDIDRLEKILDKIETNINDGNNATKFKADVKGKVADTKEKVKDKIDEIKVGYQTRITGLIDKYRDKEFTVAEANGEVIELKKAAEEFALGFQTALEELIENDLNSACDAMLKEYRKRLASLCEGLDQTGLSGITFDPEKLMEGSIKQVEFSISKLIHTRREDHGHYEHKHFFLDILHWFDRYKWKSHFVNVDFIKADELAQNLCMHVQEDFDDYADKALDYASELFEKIEDDYMTEFARLDGVLIDKKKKLEKTETEKADKEALRKKAQKNLDWIQSVRNEIDSILEI